MYFSMPTTETRIESEHWSLIAATTFPGIGTLMPASLEEGLAGRLDHASEKILEAYLTKLIPIARNAQMIWS
jgi:hypothetical protein